MSTAAKRKASPAATGEALDTSTQVLKRTFRAADRQAQRDRILEALRRRPHTTDELRRDPIGSFQCPTRIHELRKAGYAIETARVEVVDADGFIHPRVALYSLVGEPEQRQGVLL